MQKNNDNYFASPQTVDSQTSAIPIPADHMSPPLAGGWLVVGMLWVVALLNYLDRMMIMTMRDSIVKAFDISDSQFGMLTTIFLWTYGAFSPIGGYLADRFSRSRIIILSLLIWSAVTWWTGHVSSYNEFLVARALMGISEACYIPAGLALIADYHRGTTRSLATGIHMSGINLGGALGGLGGLVAERVAWHTPFIVFGVIGVIYSLVLMVWLRNAPVQASTNSTQQQTPKVDFFDAVFLLFRNRNYLLLLSFWGLLGFAGWALSKWMPTYLKESFELTQTDSGMIALGCLQGAACIGVLIGGAWADHLSKKYARGRIIVPVIGLSVASLAVFLAANAQVLGLVIVGLCGYGLSRIFCDANVMPVLCQIADPRYRATGYGILNMFSCFIGGVATYLGGYLRDQNYSLSLVFNCAGVIVICCAFIFAMIKPQHIKE